MQAKLLLVVAFTTVLLQQQLTHAKITPITDGLHQVSQKYYDDEFTFDQLSGARDPVVTARVSGGMILNKGLRVRGYSEIPDGLNVRLQMTFESMGVNNSEIRITGKIPPNSFIHFVSTSGWLSGKNSLFSFDNMQLSKNVTLLLEGTKVTWESDSEGGPVALFTGTGISSIADRSSLFILNTEAIGASSIFSVSSLSSLTIFDESIVGIDQGLCKRSTSAVVDVPQISLDASSMFRVSQIQVEGNVPLLSHSGSATVRGDSLYLVMDCTASSGSLFRFKKFTVATGSAVTFHHLNASSLGLDESNSETPISVEGVSHVYAKNIEIGGKKLSTVEDFRNMGLFVDRLVLQNDRLESGTCAYSTCMPKHHVELNLKDDCRCVCKNGYEMPACTANPDLFQGHNENVKPPCAVSNCWRCLESDQNKCAQCMPDYYLNEGRCVPKTPPLPPPPMNEPEKPTPPLTLKPGSRTHSKMITFLYGECKVKKCIKCDTNENVCQKCAIGYVPSHDRKICEEISQGSSEPAGRLFIAIASALATALLV